VSLLPRKRARRHRVPKGFMGDRPHGLEAELSGRRGRLPTAIALAACVYGLLAFLGWHGASAKKEPRVVMTASVQLEKRVEQPPPPPPPERPPPPPLPPPRVQRQARRMPDQPPAAAMAGKVVARPADAAQPLDFTGFDMVV
jgi:hypothetical protein